MTSFVPGRDTCRPVKRRQRTFRPNYLSLAGTYQCNLACPHCCVPVEWPERLDIKVALGFLEDAHAHGIGLLGFSGGEPFLYPEFLLALTNRAAELGFRFDRIATNGVWFSDRAALKRTLRDLLAAGFSGQLGLSVDKFHGRRPALLADFCRVARQVFHRDNIVALAYTSRDRHQGLEPIRALAKELGAVIDWSQQLGRYMLVSSELTMVLNWNQLAPVERAEPLGGAWDDEWFAEDYCEGPGQALVVTPRGDVKPCCGFASDLDQLTIGNIHRDDVAGIIRRGRRHPYVGQVFRRGLSSIRADIMARNPCALPGATSNHCFFCWYVLTKNLVAPPARFPGTPPNKRVSLPMSDDGSSLPVTQSGESADSVLLIAFDGKTVFLGRELPPDRPLAKGRVYLVNITGPSSIEPPPEKMTWTDYQSWIDRLRGDGYTLTTHNFSPCQK